MQDDQTLFGKPDTTSTEPATAEAEREERLSRAAREAVRQPADPRIEKSFAHLGLSGDDVPAAPARAARARTEGGPASGPESAPAPAPVDLEPIREELRAWRASADDLNRRLGIVTWILFGLTGIIGLLAVVLIVRG